MMLSPALPMFWSSRPSCASWVSRLVFAADVRPYLSIVLPMLTPEESDGNEVSEY